METKLLSLVAIFFSLTFTQGQRNKLTFYIENQTGADLYGLYVSASGTAVLQQQIEAGLSDENSWGEDLLPNDYFEDEDIIKVSVPIYNDTICDHDVLVTYGDDEEGARIFEEIDLCSIRKLIFYVKRGEIYYEVE